MNQEIAEYFSEHIQIITAVADSQSQKIVACVDVLVAALQQGNKVLLAGNGGSAADAQHFAAEIVGRFLLERKGYPAIALTTDTSILTAVGNDYGFDNVFSRQVEALAQPGDVVIGISTSGNSENVLRALNLAGELGCRTVGLTGGDGGRIGSAVDLSLIVPTAFTPHIQEAHGTIIHLLCDLVEKKLMGDM